VETDTLRDWLLENAGYAAPPGVISESDPAAPIFTHRVIELHRTGSDDRGRKLVAVS
jgi:hypothetical protein